MLNEPSTGSRSSTTSSSSSSPGIKDWMNEGFKDVQVDWMLFRQDLALVKDELVQTCNQGITTTTRAAKMAATTASTVVGSSVRQLSRETEDLRDEFRNEFQVQRRLLQHDLQDIVAFGKSWKEQVWQRRRNTTATAAANRSSSTTGRASPPLTPSSVGRRGETTPPTNVARLVQAIRDFETTLRDPMFLQTLNEQVIPSHLVSCTEMIEYYSQRPELYDYTLTKELTRMNYIIVTETGQRLTDPSDIVAYAAAQQQQVSGLGVDVETQRQLVWRAANQSLFGDVITSLTCEDGLIRPLFYNASLVNDITMTLDFAIDAPHVIAECFLQVIVPSGTTGTTSTTHSTQHEVDDRSDNEKLVLAGALIGVYFCPRMNVLQAKVVHISPAASLTETQAKGIAAALVRASITTTDATGTDESVSV